MTLLGLVESDDDIQLLNHVWQTGDMLPYLGTTDILSAGWLVCDGRLVDTTIPLGILLNGAFGTSASGVRAPAPYGGSGTGYNLPNCCDRFVQGVGNATAYQLGHSGGALGHTHAVGTLTVAAHSHGGGGFSIPSHTHSINPGDGWHDHNMSFSQGRVLNKADTPEDLWKGGNVNPSAPGYSGGIGYASAGVGGSTASAGGGLSSGGVTGASDPPHQRLNWIIHV